MSKVELDLSPRTTKRVYVLNRGAHDYKAAEAFGEVIYISDGMLSRNATGVMFRMVQEAFEDSISDDYIVISSISTLCAIACSAFTAKHGKINLLLFHSDGYIHRQIKFR